MAYNLTTEDYDKQLAELRQREAFIVECVDFVQDQLGGIRQTIRDVAYLREHRWRQDLLELRQKAAQAPEVSLSTENGNQAEPTPATPD